MVGGTVQLGGSTDIVDAQSVVSCGSRVGNACHRCLWSAGGFRQARMSSTNAEGGGRDACVPCLRSAHPQRLADSRSVNGRQQLPRYDGTCPTGYVLGSWKAHNQWHIQRQDKRQKAGADGPMPLPSSDALPAEARGVSRSGALSGADRPAGRTTLDSGAWVAASHLVAGSHRADTTQTGTATATQSFFCVPSYMGGGRSLRRQ